MDIEGLSIRKIRERLERDGNEPTLLAACARDGRKGVRDLAASGLRRVEAARRESARLLEAYRHERELQERWGVPVGGVDEAGRGPLAGPVVAACVVLPRDPTIDGIDDSKALTPEKREELAGEIRRVALGIGVAFVGPRAIEEDNIYQASLRAMREAIRRCRPVRPGGLILDAVSIPRLKVHQESVVKADATRACVMAASIIAKVERDHHMVGMEARYPGYGFAIHKGYGTPLHLEKIRSLGPSPIHRRTFSELTGEDPGWLAGVYRRRLERVTSLRALNNLAQEIRRRAGVLPAPELDQLRELFRRIRERIERR